MNFANVSDVPSLRSRLLSVTSVRGPVLFGLTAAVLCAGLFGVWAGTAEIKGATLAAGSFVTRGQNKAVQHLEGGIVAEILVSEGDRVSAGDPLVRLDTTQAQAKLQRLVAEFNTTLAREARLVAERDGLTEISYPDALTSVAASDPGIALLMADQDKEFAAKRDGDATDTSILSQKIRALEAEIAGSKDQGAAVAIQKGLIEQEVEVIQGLFDKGLISQERLLALKRTASQLVGQEGELQAAIARAEHTILENRHQIERLEDERVKAAAEEVVSLRVEKAALHNEIAAAADVMSRIVIRSPTDGIVLKRYVNTVGGVLGQGESIVDLLPLPADLVVEVRVPPDDIDRVHTGQEAAIRIPALHIPYSPAIGAVVEYVSADGITDPDTGEVYYLARISGIELPDDIDSERLYPGMLAEAFIVADPRTFLEYLIDPMLESFRRSLREK